jgi:ketosteroid isomerase-like protein
MARDPNLMPFDFTAYARAFEAKDVDALLAFYAEDAIWVEYKPGAPPSAPARLAGRAAIADYLRGVASDDDVTLTVSHEVVGEERMAFRITVGLAGGRREIEHAICELRDGLIAEHVEVEAWD